MNATGSPTSEVWLRGNVRPVLVVAAVGGLAAIALLATLFLTAAPPTAWWLAIACCLVIAAVIGTSINTAASRYRYALEKLRTTITVSEAVR